MRKNIFVLMTVGFCLAACGGGGGSGGSGGGGGSGGDGGTGGGSGSSGGDPLLGIWTDQITPTNAGDESVTLVFSQGSFTLVHTQVNPASAASKPGCSETYTDQGTFTEGAGTLAVEVNPSLSGWVDDTGCPNTADNGASKQTPVTASGTWTYSISGTTLTLTMTGGSPKTFAQH